MKINQTMLKDRSLSFRQKLRFKITLVLLCMSLFTVKASDYSQKTKISLNLDNVTVEQVFFEIKRNTEFNILFKNPDVDLNRKVTVKVKKETVDKVLDIVFSNTQVSYKIVDKQIVLTKTIVQPAIKEIIVEEEQTTTVSGVIKDDTNSPLPGASVVAKGSSIGTETDFDGNFSLEVPAGTTALVVSYLGFKTTEVNIVGKTSITLSLEADAAALDEVVVVGYGTAKRSDLTGALASVSSKDFDKLYLLP